MSRTNSYRQAVNPCVFHITQGIFGIGVRTVRIIHHQIIFLSHQLAEFCLDRSPAGMRKSHDFLYFSHILIIRQSGSINHDTAAASSYSALDFRHILMMVEVERHRHIILFHSRARECHKIILIRITDRGRRSRDNHRRTHLTGRIHYHLKRFQIMDIKGRYRIMFLLRIFENSSCQLF